MNKKQLIIASIVAVLSVTSANATSTITNITNGGDGPFNINPERINNNIGYRAYEKFDLGQDDVANLIYSGLMKDGSTRNIEHFINMVQDQVKINGVLNTVRNGNFYNGNAIFITPGGMTVGASGVLNVGALSVITPTNDKYNSLMNEYNAKNYDNINNVSHLKNGADNNLNYGGNAPVTINGTVIAKDGVDIRGSQVNIGGNIVNGYNGTRQVFDATKNAQGLNAAQVLFNSLVNTDGITADGIKFAANNNKLVIVKSGAGEGGINISGKVANLNSNAETAISNHGSNGLTVSGMVAGRGNVNLFNNDKQADGTTFANSGKMDITGKLLSGNDLLVSNRGTSLTIGNNAKLNATNELNVAGQGTSGTTVNGALSGKQVAVTNYNGDLLVGGNISSTNVTRIENQGGKLTIAGGADVKSNDTTYIKNSGSNGMDIKGNVSAGKYVSVLNTSGNLTTGNYKKSDVLQDTVIKTDANGTIKIENKSGSLNLAQGTKVQGHGDVSIKNRGNGGMTLASGASITNDGGETAVRNYKGDMTIAGNIQTSGGNLGVINGEDNDSLTNAEGMTISGNIKNTGYIANIRNYGSEDMNVTGTIEQSNGILVLKNLGTSGDMNINGNLTGKNGSEIAINNYSGQLNINNKANISADKNVGIINRAKAEDFYMASNAKVQSTGEGFINIKNYGDTNSTTNRGLDLNGTITNTKGDIAINNYKGDTNVAGTITASNGNVGIINRAGSENLDFSADLDVTGNANIKNDGDGDMTVGGAITHTGRVNVLGNEGLTTLSGDVTNLSNGSLDENNGFYAVSKKHGEGLVITDDFVGTSTNGQFFLRNRSGQNGLVSNGDIVSVNGQVELKNETGDMTVGGIVDGKDAVLLNKGEAMTVSADLGSTKADGVKVVNKGTSPANVDEATVTIYDPETKEETDITNNRKQWLYNVLKSSL